MKLEELQIGMTVRVKGLQALNPDFGFGNGKDVVRCCCKTDRPSHLHDYLG